MPLNRPASEMRAELSDELRKAGISGKRAVDERAKLEMLIANRLRDDARADALESQQRAGTQDWTTSRGAADRFGAALGPPVVGAAQSATLGYLPNLISAIPGTPSEPEVRGSLEGIEESDPIGSGVGRFAGMLMPGAGTALNLAGRGAAALTTAPLVRRAVEAPATARFATHFLNNLVQGGSANVVSRLLEHRDDQAGVGVRIASAISDFSSPAGLAIFGGSSAGSAALSSRFTQPASKDLAPIIAKFERMTGKKVPADTLTDSAKLQGWMNTFAQTPGLSEEVQKVHRSMTQGVIDLIEESGRKTGVKAPGITGARPPATEAASAVRNLVGSPSERAFGSITKTRRSAESMAMAKFGRANPIDQRATQALLDGIKALRRTRPDARAAGVEKIYRAIEKRAAGGSISLGDLEAYRMALGRTAYPSNALSLIKPTERETFEASRLYKVLTAARRRYMPEIDQAADLGERMRKFEAAVANEPKLQIDDTFMRGFFGEAGAPTRVKALLQQADPEQIEKARAWLFHETISRVFNRTSRKLTTSQRMEQVFSGSGGLNRQIVDEMLPGFRAELQDVAKLSDVMFGKGMLGPTGSQTYARGARAFLAATLPASVATALGFMMFADDPFSKLVPMLGGAGAAWVGNRIARSAVQGSAQSALRNLASGQALAPVRTQMGLRQSFLGTPQEAP